MSRRVVCGWMGRRGMIHGCCWVSGYAINCRDKFRMSVSLTRTAKTMTSVAYTVHGTHAQPTPCLAYESFITVSLLEHWSQVDTSALWLRGFIVSSRSYEFATILLPTIIVHAVGSLSSAVVLVWSRDHFMPLWRQHGQTIRFQSTLLVLCQSFQSMCHVNQCRFSLKTIVFFIRVLIQLAYISWKF